MRYKIIIIMSSIIMLFAMAMKPSTDDRLTILCHNWKQIAYKSFKDSTPQSVSDQMAKTCAFKADGSYEEDMYSLKSGGNWIFNEDKTKIGIVLTSFNGKPLAKFDGPTKTNILIIKLNRDTLIYGREAYYGPNKVYGHDDYYFVRVK